MACFNGRLRPAQPARRTPSVTLNEPDRAPLVRRPATWFGYFLVGTQIYLFNVQGNVIPLFQTEFGLSYREVSLHSVALALGVIVTGLFGQRLTSRIGRKYSLWLGGIGLGAGAFLLCLSPGLWMSVPSCFIIGLSGGLTGSMVPAVISDLHGDARDQAFAEQAIVAYAFAILGPVSTGLFVSAGLGWRGAVILGGLIGIALVVLFRNAAIPSQRHDAPRKAAGHLPATFWAYCCLLGFGCALEFSILLWGPAFLEREIGFSTAAAATGVAGFFVGMLAGRLALRVLVRTLRPRTILMAAFATGAVGFVLYWAVVEPWAAIAGIFLLGLCVSPQYPLTMALGLGVAKGAEDIAALRLTLAFGLSVLIAPAVLGALADVVGLRFAHLTLPALIAAAFASFVAAGILERRT